jgi:hypothetical protein
MALRILSFAVSLPGLGSGVLAFIQVRPNVLKRISPPHRYSQRSIFSKVERVDDAIEDVVDRQRPEKAIAALEVLLERQKLDVDMTENLLKSLLHRDEHRELQGSSLSLASSIVAGFDYGFTSRSEGSSFTEIEADFPGYGPPANLFSLGWQQFWRNLDAMKGEYKDEDDVGKLHSDRA